MTRRGTNQIPLRAYAATQREGGEEIRASRQRVKATHPVCTEEREDNEAKLNTDSFVIVMEIQRLFKVLNSRFCLLFILTSEQISNSFVMLGQNKLDMITLFIASLFTVVISKKQSLKVERSGLSLTDTKLDKSTMNKLVPQSEGT